MTDARGAGSDDGWASVPPPTGPEAPRPPASVRPSGRPAPQYGEYAPEGWVNPILVERGAASAEPPASTGMHDRTVSSGTDGAARSFRDDGSRAVGVARTGASPRDALVTFLLLAFGLVSVLQQVTGVRRLAAEVAQEIAARYTELADPHALVSVTATSAVVSAILLGLAIWWSVVRVRRRKIAFWVPLAAAAVAGLFSAVLSVVVIMHDPAFAAYIVSHSSTL